MFTVTFVFVFIPDVSFFFLLQYLMRVPILKEEHFPSEPAISSSSAPYNASNADDPQPAVHIVNHIHGQRLWGDMVPYREYNNEDEDEQYDD